MPTSLYRSPDNNVDLRKMKIRNAATRVQSSRQNHRLNRIHVSHAAERVLLLRLVSILLSIAFTLSDVLEGYLWVGYLQFHFPSWDIYTTDFQT